jgi:hypothetical protein
LRQLRQNERAATKDRDGEDLLTYPGHLFADAEGRFPVDLNDWEREVIESEIARPEFVAWYRNPGTATPASLRIAYQNDAEDWVSLQPTGPCACSTSPIPRSAPRCGPSMVGR